MQFQNSYAFEGFAKQNAYLGSRDNTSRRQSVASGKRSNAR